MSQNLLINGVAYNGVDSLEMNTTDGKKVLYFEGQPVSIVQEPGDSETAVMSQKGVTDAMGYRPDCHAAYFQITEDGVVSLKPEYRGATTKATYTYSVSDMGSGVVGSKNAELPSHLIIPEIVDGIVVNKMADGMFCDNTAFEYVTLPNTVTVIPDYCFYGSHFMRDIYNTENITVLGECGFSRASSVKRVRLPNLTTMGYRGMMSCTSMVYADIGNVTQIPDHAFVYAINIQRLKNTGGVTTVGASAFIKCAKLKHFENLDKLSNVGKTGLWASGVPYTELQKLTNCTFDTNATALQVNPTDFWSECTYTPCENPLPTYLAQNNTAWDTRAVGSKTYKSACMLFDVIHAYCGLHNVTLNDVYELEAMVNSIDTTILANYVSTYTYQTTMARKMGLTVESYGSINKTVLQTLYDALAAGKYASITITNGTNGSILGHCVLIYGVTDKGELMICDCFNAWYHDFAKPFTYTMPYQNFISPSISGRNTCLEIYSL